MGFGVTLTSVTLVSGTTYTFAGDHFAENQFDVGKVWVSIDGGTTKIYPDTYDSWGYDEITATFPELLAGDYAAGVVSGSDDPSETLANAFTVASTGSSFIRRQSLMVGLAISNC